MASYLAQVYDFPCYLNILRNKPQVRPALLFPEQMNARAFVVIFFFWALLTIITPTLVRLSESSKTDLDQNGEVSEGMKPRKMMTDSDKHSITPITPPAKMVPMSLAPAPTPAPVDRLAFSIEMLTRKQREQSSDNIMRLIRASLSKSSQVPI